MKAAFLLYKLSLKRAQFLLVTTGLLLAALQAFRVLIAASLHNAGQFDEVSALVPAFVRDFLGSSFASVMTFNGLVCGVYFDTGFMIALIAVANTLATVPTSEIETGFADLILARPLSRHWLVTRTIALVITATLYLLAMIVIGTFVGLKMFGPAGIPWPEAGLTAALAVNLGMLVLAWSAITMALGAALRRGLANTIGSLLAFAGLLVEWARHLWQRLDSLAWISPFTYFQPYPLLVGDPLQLENLLILWAMTVTGYTISYVILSQRDISR